MKPPEVGFVFALSQEAGSVFDRFEHRRTTRGSGAVFHTGILNGLTAAAVISGIGQHNAENAAALLIDVFAPKKICSAGYAAGLSPRLKKGNICVAERVQRYSDGQILDLTPGIPRQGLPENGKLTLLTVNETIHSPEQKAALLEKTGAELLDMETFAVAECCRQRKVPFLSVRIIFDAAGDPVPEEISRFVQNGKKGKLFHAGLIFRTICSRPSVLCGLFSLQKQAFTASEKLAVFLSKELSRTSRIPLPALDHDGLSGGGASI